MPMTPRVNNRRESAVELGDLVARVVSQEEDIGHRGQEYPSDRVENVMRLEYSVETATSEAFVGPLARGMTYYHTGGCDAEDEARRHP
jgi:hypothetical protein